MSQAALRSRQDLQSDYPPFFRIPKEDVDEQAELEHLYNEDHPHSHPELEQSIFTKLIRLIFSTIISSLMILLLFYPFIAIVSLIRVVLYPISKSLKAAGCIQGFINPLLALIFCSANVFIVFVCFSNDIKESPLHRMQIIKSMILFVSQILVTQYIRVIKIPSWKEDLFSCKQYLRHDKISDYVMQFLPTQSETILDFDLDILNWLDEYSNCLKSLHLQITQQRFNSFFMKHQNPHNFDFRGFQFFLKQNQPLQPQRFQYLIIAFVILVKAYALYYIKHHQGYGRFEYLLTIAISLQTINIVFCMFKLVGNYDLRRKRMMVENLIEAINFCDPDANYFKKLDITSEVSLETWDNARRIIYVFFEKKEKLLEGCFYCFLFAYIFIILIFISAFNAEIEFLFAKDSIMLHPLILLSFFIDFILLSNVILARIYAGQQLNEIFEDQLDALDAVKGKLQDLLMKYDYYFEANAMSESEFEDIVQIAYNKTYHHNNNNREVRNKQEQVRQSPKRKKQPTSDNIDLQNDQKVSIYKLIAAKIRQNANYFIQNDIEFLGQKYTKDTAHKLHIKMMSNLVNCFDSIKDQINKDQANHDYKFLNIIHMEFRETINTIAFGLISIVPSLIPQLRAKFK